MVVVGIVITSPRSFEHCLRLTYMYVCVRGLCACLCVRVFLVCSYAYLLVCKCARLNDLFGFVSTARVCTSTSRMFFSFSKHQKTQQSHTNVPPRACILSAKEVTSPPDPYAMQLPPHVPFLSDHTTAAMHSRTQTPPMRMLKRSDPDQLLVNVECACECLPACL